MLNVDAYEEYEQYTSFVASPDAGSLMFCAYLDVFSGCGVTYKKINASEGSELYVWGNVGDYPVTQLPLVHNAGWYGIPFVKGV